MDNQLINYYNGFE